MDGGAIDTLKVAETRPLSSVFFGSSTKKKLEMPVNAG
jgi:hypothetical protein